MPDGRRQVARFCQAGDLVGMTAERWYPYTADALTDVGVVSIRRADLEARMETESDLRRLVLHAIGEALSLAQEQIILPGRKSAAERGASLFRVMRVQAGRTRGGRSAESREGKGEGGTLRFWW